MKNDLQKTVEAGSWKAVITPCSEAILSFSCRGREVLRLSPVIAGQLCEAGGIIEKIRLHETVDGISATVECDTIIPFGPEPEIKRNVEFIDGFARMTVDFAPGTRGVFKRLEMDSLIFPGPWVRAGVVEIPDAGRPVGEIKWYDLNEDAQVIYSAGAPFLALVLEDGEGRRIETGCGDDIWRWQSAQGIEGCSAEFIISGNRDEINLKRTPLIFQEEIEPQIRPWRFKWYFAWEENAQSEIAPVVADAEVFDVSKHDWHESAVATSENGLSGHVCWESPAGRKRFRSLVRSVATRNVSGLVLQNAEPHLCLSAAHLERSKKVTLLHWDINDFIELYSWGNRQLLRSGASLRIIAPAESVFSKLPSGQRLSMIPTQRISGE